MGENLDLETLLKKFIPKVSEAIQSPEQIDINCLTFDEAKVDSNLDFMPIYYHTDGSAHSQIKDGRALYKLNYKAYEFIIEVIRSYLDFFGSYNDEMKVQI